MTRSRVELADLRTMADEIRRRSFGFNRRPGARNNRGRIQEKPPAAGAIGDPLTIITSVPVLQWVRADLGVTVATGVSTWLDQTANHHDFAQGTGGAQPAYTASDFTLNGRPSITGDGTDDRLINSTVPNGLGTWVSGIVKNLGWFAVDFFWGNNALPECGEFYMTGVSPACALYSGVLNANNNDGLPVGTWGRAEMYFSDPTGCYLKLRGKTISTSATAGNVSSTGANLFASGGAGYSNVAIAERVVCLGKPTAGEISALEAYYVSLYTQANVA